MKNKILSFICCIFSLVYMHCSFDDTVAGGGTDVANGFVVGLLRTVSGQPIANAQVTLINKDYNPVTDDRLSDSIIDTTDENGFFTVIIKERDIYNIQALHLKERRRALITGLYLTMEIDTINVIVSLDDPKTLRFILPETVDTVNGYLFIPGTLLSSDFMTEIEVGGDGKKYAIIDSVPFSSSDLQLYYGVKSSDIKLLVTDTLKILQSDTTVLDISNEDLKPLWKFPLIAGILEQTVEYYNGIDAVADLLNDQITSVNQKFNDPGVFDGLFYFSVDSIYTFTGPANDQQIEPPAGHAFRLVYDGFGTGASTWNKFVRVVYNNYRVGNSGGIFGTESTDMVTWFLGLARGAVALSRLHVDADKNHINSEAYTGVPSIMSSPNKYSVWDQYSINLINSHVDTATILPEIKFQAFPKSMGFYVRTASNTPIPDVKVDLYGVIMNENRLTNTPVSTGTTDVNGEYLFDKFLFTNSSADKFDYYNFLAVVINSTDTSYSWLPVTDVSNAYFANPDTTFRLEFVFLSFFP